MMPRNHLPSRHDRPTHHFTVDYALDSDRPAPPPPVISDAVVEAAAKAFPRDYWVGQETVAEYEAADSWSQQALDEKYYADMRATLEAALAVKASPASPISTRLAEIYQLAYDFGENAYAYGATFDATQDQSVNVARSEFAESHEKLMKAIEAAFAQMEADR